MSFKQNILNNIKNIPGWKTNRKIVAFSVDDYGNIRVDSKEARENMDKVGLKVNSIFDAFDALEDREDLEMLFEALNSVKDKNGKPAVFTAFAVPCNIDFEKVRNSGYREFHNELLSDSFSKRKEYDGTWELWKEGIANGILIPQFHGREHLNLKVFKEKLEKQDFELITALKNDSFTSISSSGYPTISYTAAFDFWDFEENITFSEIIVSGLNAFENVFGFRSTHFNSPGGRENKAIHPILKANGIQLMDTPLIKNEHQGNGKYKRSINYTGKKNKLGQTFQVRNAMFEPIASNIDWVSYTMQQIETAFKWNKPAIISSHRVNFCGHINPKIREKGITDLKKLLQKIVQKWPDVEFLAASDIFK